MDEGGRGSREGLETLTDSPEGDDVDSPLGSDSVETLFLALRHLNSQFVTARLSPDGRLPVSDVKATDPHECGAQQTRREHILSAASALFAERGYHGSSLRTISGAASISHPGMLHHFESKAALLDGVIDLLEAHAQVLLDMTAQLGSSLPALYAALAGPWDPKQRPMSLLATLTSEIVDPEHPGRYRLARLRVVHEHILETALVAHVEQGRLVAETDPQFIARTVMSLLLSLTVREHSVRELQNADDAEPVTEIRSFLEGYVARPRGAGEADTSDGTGHPSS